MPIAADIAARFPADTFANLDRADRMWQNLRQGQIFVTRNGRFQR